LISRIPLVEILPYSEINCITPGGPVKVSGALVDETPQERVIQSARPREEGPVHCMEEEKKSGDDSIDSPREVNADKLAPS